MRPFPIREIDKNGYNGDLRFRNENRVIPASTEHSIACQLNDVRMSLQGNLAEFLAVDGDPTKDTGTLRRIDEIFGLGKLRGENLCLTTSPSVYLSVLVATDTGQAMDDTRGSLDRPALLYPRTPAAQKMPGSLVSDAYDALKASILEGTLPPGYQAVENRIAEQLNMSRTPVHEAVIKLQNEGFLRVLPRRGVEILQLSVDDMRETYEVIIALEGMAAVRIASMADRSTAAEIIRLLSVATRTMEESLQRDDLKAWAGADDHFHRILVERSGNKRLARLAATAMDQAQRARLMTLRVRTRLSASTREHRQILRFLKQGNAAEARAAVEGHRTRASTEIMAALAAQ